MLHILLFILKVIGIILVVILGILVLLLCVVLFVPVRYEGQAKSDGTIESIDADIKVTWFLHLIKATVQYSERTLDYRIRIAWKNLHEEGKESYEKEYEEKYEETYERAEKERTIAEKEETTPEIGKGHESISKKNEEEPQLSERFEQKSEENHKIVEKEEAGDESHSEKMEKGGGSFSEKIKNLGGKLKGLFLGVGHVIEKIKCTFENICDKIRLLLQKKEKVMEFVQDETHIAAFVRAKSALFKLLKNMKPRKLSANVHFGFEEPSTTGQVLAGLSLIYPFIGGCTNIRPDFENRVLEGDAYIRGRIYSFYFVILLWRLIWSREVRMTFKDIRAFKL